MPRGRHRHSPPLHRLLPPSVIAGAPLVCAGGAWLSGDPLVLRGITAAAAAAAVVGAVVMRRWDRLAGKQVADLTRGAASERWRHEEAVAELEGDLEESRELRTRLEGKLRSKRSELAGLRNEHAALLRRYATAETERASALEGRRRLAIEASAPAKALPPARSAEPVAKAPARAPIQVTPSLYLRANAALDRLARPAAPAPVAEETDSRGKPRAASGHFTVPAAAAVVPPAAPARRSLVGGFDFFGTGDSAVAHDEDLADVVGEEALAEQKKQKAERGKAAAAEKPGTADPETHKAETETTDEADKADTTDKADKEVIDLTAHDETEQIDMGELRSALRA
ncbi:MULTISPECIES: hypothetical protein [unclassified Streptomyces]|uniref:hypothetical protein n=1 Tax=unclassified Streptomyces TaxID=2593676 RepID=UPI000DBA4A10|nr:MULTISPECIES: hypothetical protein [unclassified Streptomyces]MYT69825.1 hypothetical protein [Streptomyces sp. SID8367]